MKRHLVPVVALGPGVGDADLGTAGPDANEGSHQQYVYMTHGQ